MSRGHQRSNREIKKPKQVKAAAPVAGASPFAAPSGAKGARPVAAGGKKIPGYMR